MATASAPMGLIRRGFHEIPHLMIGGIFFVANIGLAAYGTWRARKYDKKQRIWKRRFVVVREEDFDPKKQVHDIYRKYPWW